MQQRRDEILAKKAKLAELKRQRELRANQAATAARPSIGGSSDVGLPSPFSPPSLSLPLPLPLSLYIYIYIYITVYIFPLSLLANRSFSSSPPPQAATIARSSSP